MRAKLAVVVLALASLSVAWALHGGVLRIPDRFNPWAPLHLADPPNLLTRYKLARLSGDTEQCRALIEQSGFRHRWVADRTTGPGCGLANAAQIQATGVAVGTPLTLSCRAAASLALWERHVLQPQALFHLDAPVKAMQHVGSYTCRNVDGGDRRSQHATADALDVAGFVLADGRSVRIVDDWTGAGPEAAFLRSIHAGGFRFFDTVLGPDYNAAHRDHLHFDRGSYRACR